MSLPFAEWSDVAVLFIWIGVVTPGRPDQKRNADQYDEKERDHRDIEPRIGAAVKQGDNRQHEPDRQPDHRPINPRVEFVIGRPIVPGRQLCGHDIPHGRPTMPALVKVTNGQASSCALRVKRPPSERSWNSFRVLSEAKVVGTYARRRPGVCGTSFHPSCPRLSRASRLGMHGHAQPSGITGTRPVMTTERLALAPSFRARRGSNLE